MRKYLPGRFWTAVLVIVVLLLPLGYFATSRYVEPAMKDYVRQNLPERLKTRDISFNYLPLSIKLDESRLETAEPSTVSVQSIEVNPNVRSMLSDTFVINTLEFEGVSLSFYQSGQSDTASLDESGLGPLLGSERPQSNFRINRLILSKSKIQLLESPESSSPILDLSPISLQVGPITPSRLKKGLSLDAVSGFQGVDKRVYLRGNLTVTPSFTLNGDLRFDKFNPEDIPSYFFPGLRLSNGQIRGDLSFDYTGESLIFSSINAEVSDSTLDFPESPGDETVLEVRNESIRESNESSWITIDDMQLELSDVSIDFNRFLNQTPPILVNEGLIKAGPYRNTSSGVPILGQLILREPAGLFEFKTSLPLDKKPVHFSSFLSDFRIDDVKQLNPYLGTILPVRFRTGSMIGGAKGGFSSKKLDLNFALDFNRLKMSSGRTESSTFLGIPVKIYLNYLSENDGNLETIFSVGGSPGNPEVKINTIRNRILVNLGVDAAVLGTIGLPAYLGDKVLERVTGLSLINETRNTFSSIFVPPKSADNPPTLTKQRRATPIPSRKR